MDRKFYRQITKKDFSQGSLFHSVKTSSPKLSQRPSFPETYFTLEWLVVNKIN